jgi:hypothetical protein
MIASGTAQHFVVDSKLSPLRQRIQCVAVSMPMPDNFTVLQCNASPSDFPTDEWQVTAGKLAGAVPSIRRTRIIFASSMVHTLTFDIGAPGSVQHISSVALSTAKELPNGFYYQDVFLPAAANNGSGAGCPRSGSGLQRQVSRMPIAGAQGDTQPVAAPLQQLFLDTPFYNSSLADSRFSRRRQLQQSSCVLDVERCKCEGYRKSNWQCSTAAKAACGVNAVVNTLAGVVVRNPYIFPPGVAAVALPTLLITGGLRILCAVNRLDCITDNMYWEDCAVDHPRRSELASMYLHPENCRPCQPPPPSPVSPPPPLPPAFSRLCDSDSDLYKPCGSAACCRLGEVCEPTFQWFGGATGRCHINTQPPPTSSSRPFQPSGCGTQSACSLARPVCQPAYSWGDGTFGLCFQTGNTLCGSISCAPEEPLCNPIGMKWDGNTGACFPAGWTLCGTTACPPSMPVCNPRWRASGGGMGRCFPAGYTLCGTTACPPTKFTLCSPDFIQHDQGLLNRGNTGMCFDGRVLCGTRACPRQLPCNSSFQVPSDPFNIGGCEGCYYYDFIPVCTGQDPLSGVRNVACQCASYTKQQIPG